PGSGFTVVAPAVDAIDAIAGAPEPGIDVPVRARAWQAGGGAVLRFGSSEIVLTPRGAWTLPSAATPMAVDRTTPRLYALAGSDLLVCDSACRALAAAKKRVIAVVPRTQELVILGLSDGTSAVY